MHFIGDQRSGKVAQLKSHSDYTLVLFVEFFRHNEAERESRQEKLTSEIKEFGIVFNFVLEWSQYTMLCVRGIPQKSGQKRNPN